MGAAFKIEKGLRSALYAADGCECVWCGRAVTPGLHASRPEAASLDHVVCRAAGGGNQKTNLVTSCAGCNSARRDIALHIWAAQVDAARGDAPGTCAARVAAAQAHPIRTARRGAKGAAA